MILSIADRPRYGLLEHSEAMVDYAARCGGAAGQTLYHRALRTTSSAAKARFSVRGLLRRTVRREFSTLVVWSVGITYLLLPLIRLLHPRAHIVIVWHEPGGLRQRLAKKDKFWYAVIVTLYERMFLPFANLIVTPNQRNSLAYGVPFAPLLFVAPADRGHEQRDWLVYLGRKSPGRSLDLFTGDACSRLLSTAGGGLKFSFFPDGGRSSSEDKEQLMRRALCTANLYTVAHNQSGVTPDSLRFGVPVIVSDLDAFASEIAAAKAGVVLSRDRITTETVAHALHEIRSNFHEYSSGAAQLFDSLFGASAFQRYWMPLLFQGPVPG
jgi:glycosyltransferase involved in cell wall biosynthesis